MTPYFDEPRLRRLIAATDLECFRAKSICLLIPGFGEGSRLIEGADADLLVDDLLIEPKRRRRGRASTCSHGVS
jgi:hypothetical protein